MKALPHAVEASEIGHAGRRDVNVGDERMGAIDSAVIEVEESSGLAVAHHIAASGSVRLSLTSLVGARRLVCQAGGFAVGGAVFVDGGVQFCQIRLRRHADRVKVVPVLVGAGFEMGAVAVKDAPADEAVFDGRLNDAVEDGLFHVGASEAATAVLREGGGVDDAVGER